MLTATGNPGQLNALIDLIRYVSDPTSRAKELEELRDEGVKLAKKITALNKAEGGARKLAEADQILIDARREARRIVDESKTASANAAKLIHEQRQANARATEKLKQEREDHNNAVANASAQQVAKGKELTRREKAVTTRENAITEQRESARRDIERAKERKRLIEEAMTVPISVEG